MAGKRMPNLQNTFLNHVRRSKAPLTVFLVNGVKLQGILTWFDSFSILLKQSAESQLVYKHAISTIMPLEPIRLPEHDDGAKPAPRFRSDDV